MSFLFDDFDLLFDCKLCLERPFSVAAFWCRRFVAIFGNQSVAVVNFRLFHFRSTPIKRSNCKLEIPTHKLSDPVRSTSCNKWTRVLALQGIIMPFYMGGFCRIIPSFYEYDHIWSSSAVVKGNPIVDIYIVVRVGARGAGACWQFDVDWQILRYNQEHNFIFKMGEVIASGPVLSDSLFKTRPSFRTYFRSDANALGNSVTQNESARLKRQMKFPSTVGRGDVDSFKNPQNAQDVAFTRYSDEGRFRPPAPYRTCDNSIDPVAGFVSICGDIDRQTGHDHIRSLVQLEHTPHSSTPQQRNSIRLDHSAAPPETRRLRESDPGTPYEWNSKKVHDASTRAQLGGRPFLWADCALYSFNYLKSKKKVV